MLYMHGLGGSKEGSFERCDQVASLDKEYDLTWVDMRTGICEISHSNSALRNAWRSPLVYCPCLALITGAFAGMLAWWWSACFFCVSSGAFLFVSRSRIQQQTLFAMLQNNEEVQEAQLAKAEPEVVVAFSLGAATCVRLMSDGRYNGPAVLIAPAVRVWPELCPDLLDWRTSMRIPENLRSRVVVLQGTSDSVTTLGPIAEWCDSQRIELRILQGVGHCVPFGEEVKRAIRDVTRL